MPSKPKPREQLCLCSDCSQYQHRDPITNSFLPGIVLGEDTVRKHRNRDRQEGRTGAGAGPSLLLAASPATTPLHSLKLEASSKSPFEQAVSNAVVLATQTRLSFAENVQPTSNAFIYNLHRTSFGNDNPFALQNSAANLPFLSAENLLRQLEHQIDSDTEDDGVSSRRELWDSAIKSIAEHAQQEWNRQNWYPEEADIPKRAVLTGDVCSFQPIVSAFMRLFRSFFPGV